jgi:hypothetical protein
MTEPNEALARTSRVEETALATTTSTTGELAPAASAAALQHEIQGAIVLARRFPRSEDGAFTKLMRSCGRSSFAAGAEYSFPRGGQVISGPSVQLAREAARVWGNIRHGLEIIRDDAASRQIRGWAWDLESNTKVAAEDEFRKLVQRKRKGGASEWVVPDERDLRELTNRRGAILVRNCILQLLPADLIEDAVHEAHKTLKDEAGKDPDQARKRVLLAFGSLNVTPEMLAAHLGKPVGQCSPEEIAGLRTIYQSIRDGNSTWEEHAGADETEDGVIEAGAQKTLERVERAKRGSRRVKGSVDASSEVEKQEEATADRFPQAAAAIRARDQELTASLAEKISAESGDRLSREQSDALLARAAETNFQGEGEVAFRVYVATNHHRRLELQPASLYETLLEVIEDDAAKRAEGERDPREAQP